MDTDSINIDIGRRIRNHRNRNGLTQQELADRLGVIQQQVAKWEAAGANPQAKTLKRIAEALGCSIDELIVYNYFNKMSTDL